MTRPRRARGLTLVEMTVTIVILGIALTLIFNAVARGTVAATDATLEARAIALAQSYLDEVLSRRFDQDSPAGGIPPYKGACRVVPGVLDEGGRRVHFNDVDDYHGLSEGFDPDDEDAPPLRDARGEVLNAYANFGVGVEVSCVDGADADALGIAADDLKRVTVTVRHANHRSNWEFSAYKVNF